MFALILKKLILGGALFFTAFTVLFSLIYQPWELHWGATEEEIQRHMPGDELVDHPTFNATRSVTINASPEEIWPWIVQIGYRRAGFYSHDWLDNDGIPSAEQIIPEYQTLQEGDMIPLSRTASARVESLQPNRSLLLVYESKSGPIFTWVWGIYPIDREQTRMVVRLRWYQRDAGARILTRIFEIVMMKKHMLGIKKRAESTTFLATAGDQVQAATTPPDATIWYLGHCGYAIQTTNHLLIFDYIELEEAEPEQPVICPEKRGDRYVFSNGIVR